MIHVRSRIFLLFVAALIGTTAANAQPGNQSKRFESAEDKFSIAFPSTPERRIDEAEAWFGKGAIITYLCRGDEVIYRLSFVDLPQTIVDEKEMTRRLDVLQGGERLQWGLNDIKETRGKFKGYDGREMISEGSVVTMSSRSIFVGKRFVYLSAFIKGTSKTIDPKVWPSKLALIQDYFNSFEPAK